MHEADIGSGEKKPGENDTQKEVSKVGNPQMNEKPANAEPADDPDEQDRARATPRPGR